MLKIFFFSSVLCLCLTACSVLEEPDELTIINISADYVIELSQSLQLGPNLLMINVRSTDSKNCTNSYIDMSTNVAGDQIQLILGEIIHPAPCDELSGYVEAQSSFELSPRQYSINISLKNVVQNHGIIDVLLDRYQLNLETENGILIKEPVVKIIPDGYAWGQIEVANQDHQSTLNDVLATVQEANIPHNLDDGNYGYFIIRDGQIELSQEDKQDAIEVFIVKQEESFEELTNRFKQFSNLYQTDIQLTSSTGDSYSN